MLSEDFNVHDLVKSLANTNRYKITPIKDFCRKITKNAVFKRQSFLQKGSNILIL